MKPGTDHRAIVGRSIARRAVLLKIEMAGIGRLCGGTHGGHEGKDGQNH